MPTYGQDLGQADKDTGKSCVFDFPDRPVDSLPPNYPPGIPPDLYPYNPVDDWPPIPPTYPIDPVPGVDPIPGSNPHPHGDPGTPPGIFAYTLWILFKYPDTPITTESAYENYYYYLNNPGLGIPPERAGSIAIGWYTQEQIIATIPNLPSQFLSIRDKMVSLLFAETGLVSTDGNDARQGIVLLSYDNTAAPVPFVDWYFLYYSEHFNNISNIKTICFDACPISRVSGGGPGIFIDSQYYAIVPETFFLSPDYVTPLNKTLLTGHMRITNFTTPTVIKFNSSSI